MTQMHFRAYQCFWNKMSDAEAEQIFFALHEEQRGKFDTVVGCSRKVKRVQYTDTIEKRGGS